MSSQVEMHYAGAGGLADRIADKLREIGKDIAHIKTEDLAAIDEFHIRGRKATLELARKMELSPASHVLDIGSGLGGPARTLAEVYGCRVTGIDLTQEFCDTANAMSQWVGLAEKVSFVQGDATTLDYAASFDAAMTIHVAMNIANKDAVYAGAYRALKPGGIFAVYDILQGEGGAVLFPVPWAREPAISHLATPTEMRALLAGAGFTVLEEVDTSEESGTWFKQVAAKIADSGPPPISLRMFLGDDHPQMTLNQVRNLAERRIRTATYICRR